MRAGRIAVALVASVLATCGAGHEVRAADRASATLAVWRSGEWRTFWRSSHAPTRWAAADSTLAGSLPWKPLAPGLEWASVRLACGAPVWRAQLIVARLDPRVVRLSLHMDLTRGDLRPAWSVDRAPGDALLAVNAGQFVSTMPWGWVVIEGRQYLRPGRGPLASAIAIDAGGNVRWCHGDSIAAAGVVTGLQSYPTLLAGDGVVPPALRTPGSGVDLSHHDARLALGTTRDSRMLIAMTRFDVMSEAAGSIPLGPTTPEMAAVMGALGASDAVMLDGGISAQLLLRDPARKAPLEWRGLRRVPLALIARSRAPANRPGLSAQP